MKAVRIHQHGGVEQLRFETSADPDLNSPTNVLIRLHAAAVNRLDVMIRREINREEVRFPHILGVDGAGTIIEVGSAVKNVNPGDGVCLYPATGCGQCAFCGSDREFMCAHLRLLGERENGTYAEYVTVPARNSFPIPAGLSFEEAAAFPLVFLTAWRMLVTNAEIRPGESVLILGIGGGVASAALLIAKFFGARIIVTSSSDAKLMTARQLGAEQTINYRDGDFSKAVRSLTGKRGVDVVVDCVGGEGWVRSLAALAKGGRLVTCGATAGATPQTELRRIFWNDLQVFGSSSGSRAEFLQVLNFFSVSGAKPIIDQVYPLNDAGKAHLRLEEGKQFGKIILRMND
ncbi:MAG TPA: zinc-binding dehydrogenase [Acidobacteriota bacterium]|nr:zinc-binding dehydrogenase [Acidobacteriota bacterium]